MEPTNCNFCKRPLSNDPKSDAYDCGGDCLRCMAEIAEDPDCIIRIAEIDAKAKEAK